MASTSKVAVSGGIVILLGGLALALYTATSVPALQSAKEKAVAKYSGLVDSALAKGDKSAALKAAKEALVVDAKSKSALNAYKKVILADAPKTTAAPAKSEVKAATPTKTAPAKPAQSEDDEMGCI